MRRTTLLLALALGLGTAGCIGDTADVDASSENVSAKNVDWEPWEEPMVIDLGEPIEAEVAYGQCEQTSSSVEEKDGVINVDIEVDCGTAWGEVAWFVLSAESLAEAGGNELSVAFDTDDVVRAQILSEDADGTKTKLALDHDLTSGESLTAPLYEGQTYHLQVARGYAGESLWGPGSVHFTLVATTQDAAPADAEAAGQ
jgi:hypothetical protein